jgi:ParB family chromosome partitioning protein
MKKNDVKLTVVAVGKLHRFARSPFKDVDEDKVREIAESVETAGLLLPPTVRQRDGGGYEVISGWRRRLAMELAGEKEMPVLVISADDDTAAILHVDSNILSRDSILPSERAFAYKMKLDALAHQGRACGHEVHKSRDLVSGEMGGRQVARYVRLTYLIPELLKMVDEGRMALAPAVSLSFLPKSKQWTLHQLMEAEERTPSHAQAIRMHEMERTGRLTERAMSAVMREDKPNQKERLRIPTERIGRFFPKSATPDEMVETIVRLLEEWHRKRERERHGDDRGAR